MKKIAIVVGALCALTSPVWAQPVGQSTLSGNECWNAGQGPGGPSTGFVCAYMTRNSQGIFPTPGSVGSFTMTPQQSDVVFTAQPIAQTITLTPTPIDGQIVEFVNGTVAAFVTNVITVAPSAGQTLVGGNITLTTLAAGASRELRYSAATNSWYPLR
jgi:hypothetical protein